MVGFVLQKAKRENGRGCLPGAGKGGRNSLSIFPLSHPHHRLDRGIYTDTKKTTFYRIEERLVTRTVTIYYFHIHSSNPKHFHVYTDQLSFFFLAIIHSLLGSFLLFTPFKNSVYSKYNHHIYFY